MTTLLFVLSGLAWIGLALAIRSRDYLAEIGLAVEREKHGRRVRNARGSCSGR